MASDQGRNGGFECCAGGWFIGIIDLQIDELERLFTFRELQGKGAGTGRYNRHFEVRQGEAWSHPLVHRLHQGRGGTPVVEQVVDSIRCLSGLFVGVEISSSKAVDRLLGITHHQQ